MIKNLAFIFSQDMWLKLLPFQEPRTKPPTILEQPRRRRHEGTRIRTAIQYKTQCTYNILYIHVQCTLIKPSYINRKQVYYLVPTSLVNTLKQLIT